MESILKVLNFIAASFSQLLSGLAAIPLWGVILRAIEEPHIITEILSQPKGLPVILALPIFTVAFTAYAIGGQKLLRKVAPKLAEKEFDDSNG